MSTISKTVANRIINAKVVTASFDVHGPDTVDDLANVFHKAGIHDFDAAAARKLMGQLSDFVKNATEQLESAETAYVEEISNDGDKRDTRDNAVVELRDELQYARTLLTASVNRNALRNWGLEQPVPTAADRLLIYANHCTNQLRQNPRTITRGGITIDTNTLADLIEIPRSKLKNSLDDLKLDSRENQLSLDKRNTVLDDWNLAYGTSATIISELFRLAGRKNLASRVRPTARRASGEVIVGDDKDKEDEVSNNTDPTDNQDVPKSTEPQEA